MALTQVSTIHGFLARFDDAGSFKGAQVDYREAILNDGVEITSRFLDPHPVTADDATALAQIASTINTAALADNAAKDAQIATLTQDKGTAESARDAALAQVATLQAQLDDLQTPVDENGVPKEVSMRQAQLVMLGTPVGNATLLDAVEAAISKMAASGTVEGRAAQITWDKSSAVKRDNPLIAQLKAALGLTDPQIDALFVAASKL